MQTWPSFWRPGWRGRVDRRNRCSSQPFRASSGAGQQSRLISSAASLWQTIRGRTDGRMYCLQAAGFRQSELASACWLPAGHNGLAGHTWCRLVAKRPAAGQSGAAARCQSKHFRHPPANWPEWPPLFAFRNRRRNNNTRRRGRLTLIDPTTWLHSIAKGWSGRERERERRACLLSTRLTFP